MTKAIVAKQKKRERLVNLKWEKRQALKKKIFSLDTSEEDRLIAQKKLNEMSRNSSPVRLRNRCILTGRPRGFLRKFKMSRLCFREAAHKGLIPGLTKASW